MNGEEFLSDDGCNKCWCQEGKIFCGYDLVRCPNEVARRRSLNIDRINVPVKTTTDKDVEITASVNNIETITAAKPVKTSTTAKSVDPTPTAKPTETTTAKPVDLTDRKSVV